MKQLLKQLANLLAYYRNNLLIRKLLKRYGREIEKRLQMTDQLPGEKVLILAPHVDDDIIGCGYAIKDYLNRGKHVEICYLTKGDAARPAFSMSKDEMKRARENEAIHVAHQLGLDSANLHFLEGKEGDLWDDESITRNLSGILDNVKPEVIYCPVAIDRHPDHIATGQLLVDALGGGTHGNPLIMMYEVQNPLTLCYANIAFPVEKDVPWKRKMCRLYKSQSLTFDFLEPMSRYNAAFFDNVDNAELYLQTDVEKLKEFFSRHRTLLEQIDPELYNVRNERTFGKAYKTALEKKVILTELY